MCKQIAINSSISQFPTTITVWGLLAPVSDYIWVITDVHGNVYNLPFTTDEDGVGKILASQLPEGFFNPAMQFTIQVKTNVDNCDVVPMTFLQKVDKITACVVKSNTPMTAIGCPVDIPIPNVFQSKKHQFVGAAAQQQFPLNNDPDVDVIKEQIKKAKQILVFNESGFIQEGDAYDQYTVNPTTGIITFNQSIEGQEVTIIITY